MSGVLQLLALVWLAVVGEFWEGAARRTLGRAGVLLLAGALLTCAWAVSAPQAHAEQLRHAPLPAGRTETLPVLDQGATDYCTGYASAVALDALLPGNPYGPEGAERIARRFLHGRSDPAEGVSAQWELADDVAAVSGRGVVLYPSASAALRALRAGHPVVFFVPLLLYDYADVWWASRTPVLHPGPEYGPRTDSHALAALSAGGGFVAVQNSWGPSWGRHGRALLRERDFIRLADAGTHLTGVHSFSVI